MSRIATPATVEAAPEASRPLLEAVGKQLGVVEVLAEGVVKRVLAVPHEVVVEGGTDTR